MNIDPTLVLLRRTSRISYIIAVALFEEWLS